MAIVCESCRTPVWIDENDILMTLPKYCIDGVDQINCLPYYPGDYHDTPMLVDIIPIPKEYESA